MELKINGSNIAAFPAKMQPQVLDLDDANSTTRTADGTLNRDRVAVKRKIKLSWNALPWSEMSALLKQMSGVFFEFTYPDPMEGKYVTKTMYVGDRTAPVAFEEDGVLWWTNLEVTLTEK